MAEKKEGISKAGLQDSVVVEVKGPDPEEWGHDEDRPSLEFGGGGLEIGEIQNEGTDEEVKGPGKVWEKDDDGEFVNR